MNKKDTEFRKRLLATFMIEAEEHLKAISSGLVSLERELPADEEKPLVETVFRASHSLKGAARAVNLPEIERICQSLEDCFQTWKRGGVNRLQEPFDVLYSAVEIMRSFLSSCDADSPETGKVPISKLLNDLARFEAVGGEGEPLELKRPEHEARAQAAEARPSRQEGGHAANTVRIAAEKLNKLLLETEEMLTARLASAQLASQLTDAAGMIDLLKKEFSKVYLDVMPSVERGEGRGLAATDAARLAEFLNWTQTHVRAMEGRFKSLAKSARLNQKAFDRMTGALLDDIKEAMTLPFSTLLEGFPMLVRSISHEQGKLIDLEIRGEGLEIDRRILEDIKDPLIHLVRNSVDHGIEKPEDRTRLKKPERGRILISISHAEGSKAEIVISDDGAGINLRKVRDAAVKNGVLSREDAEKLADEEVMPYIFHSGVSTSPIITDISGRGLGLAIVREKVDKLGGSVSARTRENSGTEFRITVPLTIATFHGILVKASGAVFIVPTSKVLRTLRVKEEDIMTVENRESITLDDRPISFVRLETALDLPVKAGKKAASEARVVPVIVLGNSEKSIAFGVEDVMGEQEVLVKPLGPQLVRVRNVAGAAILGTGKPVPVLNAGDLLVSAVKAAQAARAAAPAREEGAKRRHILVVEDSITSRILLKNILEGSGYDVKTAVDGVDAITALKTEPFDLVVSDIEMPRMSGIDLTAKIRADKKLSELPVVLVTALESREDKERGVNVGANAYIVKSSFNQGNLLEVIKRLI